MVLIMPKEVSFTWFKSLVSNDPISHLSAYLAFKALTETEAVIQGRERTFHIKPPKIFIIDSSNNAFNAIQKMGGDVRSSLNKYNDPLEIEFKYRPDYLGFYLADSVNYGSVRLEPGIYLMADRISWYVKYLTRSKLNIDPNVLIGTVFYHEYMHMLLDIINFKHLVKKRTSNYLSITDVEEIACEGLSTAVTPNSASELISEMLLPYLLKDKIRGQVSFNLLGFNFKVSYVRQLIDREVFLSMWRSYPYRLVRNFFCDKWEIGWVLLNELLTTKHIEEHRGLEAEKRHLHPKVFIVIKDRTQETFKASVGEYEYKYRGTIIY